MRTHAHTHTQRHTHIQLSEWLDDARTRLKKKKFKQSVTLQFLLEKRLTVLKETFFFKKTPAGQITPRQNSLHSSICLLQGSVAFKVICLVYSSVEKCFGGLFYWIILVDQISIRRNSVSHNTFLLKNCLCSGSERDLRVEACAHWQLVPHGAVLREHGWLSPRTGSALLWWAPLRPRAVQRGGWRHLWQLQLQGEDGSERNLHGCFRAWDSSRKRGFSRKWKSIIAEKIFSGKRIDKQTFFPWKLRWWICERKLKVQNWYSSWILVC